MNKMCNIGIRLTELLMVAFLLVIAGCHANNGEGTRRTDSQNVGVFRLNLSTAISSLDPLFAKNQSNTWGINLLYSGLVRLDEDLELVGDIASSWNISSDGLTYTFTLRDDIVFHDDPVFEGLERYVTADDFVYSFQRLSDPDNASTGAWLFNNLLDVDSAFTALDDQHFRIKLKQPFEALLSRLTMQYCSVVPKEAVIEYGPEFRRHPVGTGPFKFIRWDESEQLILVRNKRYYEKDDNGNRLPYIEGVHISFIAAKGTEFLKFLNGELDMVSDLDPGMQDQVLDDHGNLTAEYAGKVRMLKGPYLNTEYLAFQMESKKEDAPWKKRAFRRAVNMSIDRKSMLDNLRHSKGIPAAGGMVPPVLLGGAAPHYGYEYNPDMARHLLETAGYTNGEDFPEITLYTTEEYLDLSIYIQKQLEKLNVPIRLQSVDGGFLYELKVKGECGFFRASWIADYPDAESFLSLLYGQNGAPPNYTRYKNAFCDSLYELGVQTTNIVERQRIYRQMDSLVMLDAPVVPLYYDEVWLFCQNNVTGLKPNAMNMLNLTRVRKIQLN